MIRLEFSGLGTFKEVIHYLPPYGNIFVRSSWLFFPQLIGKQVLAVYKDKVGYTEIILLSDITAPEPTGKHCAFYSDSGLIKFPTWVEKGELVVILYQDINGACITPSLQSGFALPDADANLVYNSSFYIGGTAPFTLSAITKPAWMTITLSGTTILFGGKPATSDVGSAIPVSFTITNACGNTNFNQTVNIILLPANFGKTVYLGSDLRTGRNVLQYLTGMPGVTVTMTLDAVTNTNGGTISVDLVTAVLGNTYLFTFDLNGTAKTNISISGLANWGTEIIGHFTLTAVSAGTIGVNNTYQILKKF